MRIPGNIFKRISEDDKALQKALRNLIGFKPNYLPYYVIAVTHRSKTDKVAHNNERLEFLGDAFIGAVIGEYLFKKYPTQDEGYLTEMRSRIVSRNSLNEIARRMGLQKLVRYNQYDKILRRSQIFGNALEALVGAVYLDAGFAKTRTFIIEKLIANHVDMDLLESTDYNFKNKVYTWAQRHEKEIDFVTTGESVEAGRKVFTISIIVEGNTIAAASGYTKKEAGQRAAERALDVLHEIPIN